MRRSTAALGAVLCSCAFAAEGDLWVAGNGSMEIAVSKKSGTVERLLDKAANVDYCDQVVSGEIPAREFTVGRRIGGLTLYDELRQREFSDLNENAAVAGVRASSDSLAFQKRFPGAEFVVTERFQVLPDHIRWDVRVKKTRDPDRTIRVVQFAPLPLGRYTGWAPVSDTPYSGKPYVPFAVEYGQSRSGSVGEARWRTNIPMMVFYSLEKNRALAFTSEFDVPSVRIRFLNNTGAASDFHWNSRKYPLRERPYFQVSHEYLGVRDRRDVEVSLLISSHEADWRPALGWVYEKYRRYFDPAPHFDPWDGVYIGGAPVPDEMGDEEQRRILAGRRERGARWEELHLHFPWYGLMIPEPGVGSWVFTETRPAGVTITRDKIRRHTRLNREFGIGTFIYYNTTESVHRYAEENFASSIARDEEGKPIGAWYAAKYPDEVACWLMNSDPKTPFGQHMIRQARSLVETYPEIAGFFWDVYGRSYMFDFAHDDGVTMVNNKPAYYPLFMFQRMMREHVGPLLRSKGMCVTANKPVTIWVCDGVDGIMSIEDTPDEETPSWIAAQSFLGLNRHVMILDGESGTRAERFLLNCFRYGMFPSDMGTRGLPPERVERNAELARAYLPFIQRFRGKKWIFHPRALELPRHTDGNIFRARDGSVIVPFVSYWRAFRNAEGFDRDLLVTCRLPDASEIKHVYAAAIDLKETTKLEPRREGDTLRITVPRHGKATMLVLSAREDATLEAARGR